MKPFALTVCLVAFCASASAADKDVRRGRAEKRVLPAEPAVVFADPFAEAELPKSDDPGAAAEPLSQTFVYVIQKRLLVGPAGTLTEPGGATRVRADFDPSSVTLVWDNGVKLTYQVTGHEPISEQQDGKQKLVAALRAFRVASSGSIEQLIMTMRQLVLTSPGVTTSEIAVTYADMVPASAITPAATAAAARNGSTVAATSLSSSK